MKHFFALLIGLGEKKQWETRKEYKWKQGIIKPFLPLHNSSWSFSSFPFIGLNVFNFFLHGFFCVRNFLHPSRVIFSFLYFITKIQWNFFRTFCFVSFPSKGEKVKRTAKSPLLLILKDKSCLLLFISSKILCLTRKLYDGGRAANIISSQVK